MQAKKLEKKDFKDFEALFNKNKDEIKDKFFEEPVGGISEDIVKVF